MLIVQHIWTTWTKELRGANAPVKRPRLAEAYELPGQAHELPGDGGALLHELRALWHEDFGIRETYGPIARPEWRQAQWNQSALLDWHLKKDGAEIVLQSDTHRRQTKWPAFLPSPLFTLRSGETARIDWNGRFRTSLSGANRASYYEQHTYWLALADEAAARLFLDATPRKHVDLRAEIY